MMATTSEKKNRAHIPNQCPSKRRGAGIILAVLSVLFLLGTGAVRCTQAQTFTVLHNFFWTDGASPYAGLVRDSDGNLYGTTSWGGSSAYGNGTVFKLDSSGGGFTVLHSFSYTDGMRPNGVLVMDSSSNLYGTTEHGGSSLFGTVFKLDSSGGGFTVLHSFADMPNDGVWPDAGLVMDSSGNLYGTTVGGASSVWGTVFKLDSSGGGFTLLHSFSFSGSDGSEPRGGLVMDSEGNLYGTTSWGGSLSNGTVFKLDSSGGGFTVLHSFAGYPSEGGHPSARLMMDSSGNLYGTTVSGGSSNGCTDMAGRVGCGTVFKLDSSGGGFTVLHSFSGSDGSWPVGGLVMDSEGNLYGTTAEGGSSDFGTVFKLDSSGGGFTVLHSFSSTDGAYPYGDLVMDPLGNLYGTTNLGGTSINSTNCSLVGCGTVFEISTTPQGAAQVIGHKVIDLVEDGVINNGQYNALELKLQHVIDMINAGKINGAIGILESLIGQVNALYNSGVLNADQWNELISDATSLIQQLQAG